MGKGNGIMNLGAVLVLLKFAEEADLLKPPFVSIVKPPTYGKETALRRAEEGLGL